MNEGGREKFEYLHYVDLIVNPMCENFIKQFELIEIHYFLNINFSVVNRHM